MNQQAHNKLVSFIWSIADDCLRDVYVRGKYRDVILPMVVLRRLDTLLEPTKEAVLTVAALCNETMRRSSVPTVWFPANFARYSRTAAGGLSAKIPLLV